MRRVLSTMIMAFLILPLLFAESAFVQENELSVHLDLTTEGSYLTTGWDQAQAAYDAVLNGVLGINDLDSNAAYYTFTLTPTNTNGLYFTTPSDSNARIPYKVQLVPRGSAGSGSGDYYPFIKETTNGTYYSTSNNSSIKANYTSLPGTQNLNNMRSFCSLNVQNSTMSGAPSITMWRKTNNKTNNNATYFKQLHMDVIILVDEVENYDDITISDDYIASFTITAQGYNLQGSPVGTVTSTTMTLHGFYLTDPADIAEESSRTSFFDIQPTELASYFSLDDDDNISSYHTVALIQFFSATETQRGSNPEVTSLANIRYAIILSSEPNAAASTSNFHFSYTKDSTKTIDYTVRLVGTTDSSQFTNLVNNNLAYFTNSSPDLTGTETINIGNLRSNASLTGTRRYVLVPQTNRGRKDKDGQSSAINYYYQYKYNGEIQIKLPTGFNPATRPAGLYTTNIYVTLISF